MTELFADFSKELKDLGIKLEDNVSLAKKTSFKIGGCADVGVFPKTPEEFSEALKLCHTTGAPHYVIGRGSNLLADDDGFRGAVIFTEALSSVKISENRVSAMAGAGLTPLSRQAGAAGLAGFEFACGIPGSVGGAVVMNAGAYGGEIADVFSSCIVYREGEGIVHCTKEDGAFSYRHTSFLENRDYVLEAQFELAEDSPSEIRAREEELLSRRREKQPLEYPSAGSAFKRPEGYFAAKLIEDAGLKGLRVGGAQVSEKHSGFVVNLGCATSQDVRSLMERVREEVEKRFGVILEPEVRYLSPEGEKSI